MSSKHWSAALIGFVGLIYVGIFVTKIIRQDYPGAAIWFGYALANFGFLAAELQGS